MTGRSVDPRTMGTLQRLRMLASDTAVYGLASAVNKSFSLVLFPVLTRSMSVADYGRLDLMLYAAMVIGLVIIWGQDSAVARLFFETDDVDERRQTITQALLIMVGAAATALLVIALVWHSPIGKRWFGPGAGGMVALLLLFAPVSGLLSFCQSLLKWTFVRNRYLVLALGAPAANLVILLALSGRHGFGPVTALAVMTAVAAVFALIGIAFVRRWIARPRGGSEVGKLLPLAIPYGLIAAIGAASPLAERAVLSARFGTAELGLYAAAGKLASITTMLSVAFQMGWGPFSYAIYRQPDAARTYNLVLRGFTALMCLAVLVLAALGEPLATFLAGDRYRGASAFVFPIAMALGVQAIGWITEIGNHLAKRPHLNLPGFAAFFAISLSGIVLFSGWLGVTGVPLGALAGQIAMMVISAAIAQRAFPIAWQFGLPVATLFLTLITGGAAMVAAQLDHGPPPAAFFAAGIVLVVAVNSVFGFGPDERRHILALAGRLRTRGGGRQPIE